MGSTHHEETAPEKVSRVLEACLRARDLDGVMALYEPEAVFADVEGVYPGLERIREAHQEFLDSGLELTLDKAVTFEAGDIALVHWAWTVMGADGSSMEGVSAEVLRRQGDGSWKYIVDNSDGQAVVIS
jgi:uncharacterized protein (TIGR02246 family)